MREKIKIAFAHDNINPNAQGILAGVTEYVRSKGDWQLIIWPDVSHESLSFLKRRDCKGVFVNAQTATRARELLRIGMPVIVLSAMQEMLNLPFVSADSEQVAVMAGEYYINKKFENFAFFGLTAARWSRERMEFFSKYLKKYSYELQVFKEEQIPITNAFTSFAKLWTSSTLSAGQQTLVEWLRQLPKPTAILASCDVLGCHLSNVAREAGLDIPDEIAVMGVNNDQAMCSICDPPLSSIAFNFKRAGHEATELLERLIRGQETMRGQCIQIQPTHVESRGSTDILAIDDSDIVQALKYIRQRSNEPLQVEDIANHVCVSKRSLQLKFKKVLGKSIHKEIVQAHFEIARALLLETDLSIDEIALRSGFHYTSNMRRAFKNITGSLPQKYRQLHHSH